MKYDCPVCGEVDLPDGARKCWCRNPVKIEVQAVAQSEDVPAIEVSSYKNKRKTKF